MDVMRSVLGTVVSLAIAFSLSVNKKKISLCTAGAALVLQAVIGGIILWLPPGRRIAEEAAFDVHKTMVYSDVGNAFIFGSLVGPRMDTPFDDVGFIFGLRVPPAIIFVTVLVDILYCTGMMGILVRILDGIFQKALDVNEIESFIAVTTISLGQNEIPAIVEPLTDCLSHNELFTVICSGMAPIAGSTMTGYAALDVPVECLLMASLMATPGGILFARPSSPTTGSSQISFNNLPFTETPPKNIIEAAATGAMAGLKIAIGVATVVMAFVVIVASINDIIGDVSDWLGFEYTSLESILGYLLAPLTWMMGVGWNDANLAGSLIGQELAINEFVAYLNFSPYLQTTGILDAKTAVVIFFVLCGFASFGSIGVVVGVFPAVVPHRAPEIAQFDLRALTVVMLSSLMSATIVGFFIGLA